MNAQSFLCLSAEVGDVSVFLLIFLMESEDLVLGQTVGVREDEKVEWPCSNTPMLLGHTWFLNPNSIVH